MQEAQLIGRGARYFPFTPPDSHDVDMFKRKYDKNPDVPLRILEQLHYHCEHNPKYIYDIRNALHRTGMLNEDARSVSVRVKDKFKRTRFYKSESVWTNDRKTNTRSDVSGLGSYGTNGTFTYPRLSTKTVTEQAAFGEDGTSPSIEPVTKSIQLPSLGKHVLRFAMDTNPFFHFSSLKTYFPRLTKISEFITAKQYLGGAAVEITGTPERLAELTTDEKVGIARHVLGKIERAIRNKDSAYRGTYKFSPAANQRHHNRQNVNHQRVRRDRP